MVATAIDLQPCASFSDEDSGQLRVLQHIAGEHEKLVCGAVSWRISVASEVADKARIALHRMLEI